MWGPDVPNVDPKVALRHFTIVASGFVTFALMCKYLLTPEMPAIRREYPFDGLVKELGGLEENKVGLIGFGGLIYWLTTCFSNVWRARKMTSKPSTIVYYYFNSRSTLR